MPITGHVRVHERWPRWAVAEALRLGPFAVAALLPARGVEAYL